MKRRICLGIAALIALGAIALVGARPARAGDDPLYYVALGDSVANGAQPTPSGQTRAIRAANGTNRGYVDELYARAQAKTPNLRLKNYSCSGETTGSLVTGGLGLDYRCGYGNTSQLAQVVDFLSAHRGQIAFVTINIGANDLRLADPFAAIAANLPGILEALRTASGQEVPIVGMNYYDPFVASTWFATHDVAAVVAEVAALATFNDLLESIYASFAVPVADVAGAFSVADTTIQPNGLPLDVQRACEWTWICSVGDTHPTDAGYSVIADAFAPILLAP